MPICSSLVLSKNGERGDTAFLRLLNLATKYLVDTQINEILKLRYTFRPFNCFINCLTLLISCSLELLVVEGENLRPELSFPTLDFYSKSVDVLCVTTV